MPRKSTHQNSDESPVTRRQSARIAAVQAASPAKTPAKSPRSKRRSTEQPKAVADDTDSQQLQLKDEGSVEELNGLETTETSSSTKDPESISDLQEAPAKKARFEETETDEAAPVATESEIISVEEPKPAVEESSHPAPKVVEDFEVLDTSSVPPPDSEEVRAAISVQGDAGKLLVDFVQVDKSDLPSAEILEAEQLSLDAEEKTQSEHTNQLEPERLVPELGSDRPTEPERESELEGKLPSVGEIPPADTINGGVEAEAPVEDPTLVCPKELEEQVKPVSEIQPAAGDGSTDQAHLIHEVAAP